MDLGGWTQYGYGGIALALILEFLALPLPGEELLVFSGFLTFRGHFNLAWVLLFAALGSVAGFFCAFFLGRRFGRPLLERYGKYVHLSGERLERAERLFARYRWPLLLLGRYVVGVRHAVPYLAGFSDLRLATFAAINVIGSILWVVPLVYAGRALGDRWNLVVTWSNRFGLWVLAGVAFAFGLVYLIFALRRRNRGRA